MGRIKAYFTTVLLFVTSCLMGCGGTGPINTEPAQTQTDSPVALAPPSKLHITAYAPTDLVLQGNEFNDSLSHNRVIRDGNSAVFTPDWRSSVDQDTGLAHATYLFQVDGYDLAPVLHIELSQRGAAKDGWIALANFVQDRWDWFAIPATEGIEFDFGQHISTEGCVYATIMLIGSTDWRLDQLSLGNGDQRGDWSMYGHDRRNSCQSSIIGCQTGTLKWAFKASGPGNLFTESAVAEDGTVYVGSGTDLHALNPDGSVKWIAEFCTPHGRPAIGADGTVYVGTRYGPLWAFNPDGSLKWRSEDKIYSEGPPVLAEDGTIYSCYLNELYATNPDGTTLWTRRLYYHNLSTPALGSDGTIYCTNTSGTLFVVSPEGVEQWRYETGEMCVCQPLVDTDGQIYYASLTGILYAIDSDGNLAWSAEPSDGNFENLAINGSTVYFPCRDRIIAYSQSGEILWEYASDNPPIRGISFDSAGNLYIGVVCGGMHVVKPDGSFYWSYADAAASNVTVADDGTIYSCEWEQEMKAIHSNGSLKWTYTTGGKIYSSPAIAADGTIYVGCDDSHLYSVSPEGTENWHFDCISRVRATPAIRPDGTICFGSHIGDSMLFTLNPDGNLRWEYPIYGYTGSSPTLALDGTILVGGYSVIWALTPGGDKRWVLATGSYNDDSPAIGPDGTIYQLDRNKLFATNPDGTPKWTYTTGAFEYSHEEFSPAVGTDGTIYLVGGEDDPRLYAINPDGTPEWIALAGDYIRSSPAVSAEGIVFVGADKSLQAYSADGDLVWEFDESNGCFQAPPCIGADGSVYAGNTDAKVYALNPDGSLKWAYTTGAAVYATPVIADDGTVYVGSTDGRLYAFGD